MPIPLSSTTSGRLFRNGPLRRWLRRVAFRPWTCGADGDLPGFRNWQNAEHIGQLAQLWDVDPGVIPHWAPLNVYHFHTRTKTSRSPQLNDAAPHIWVELSSVDAQALGKPDVHYLQSLARQYDGHQRDLAPAVERYGEVTAGEEPERLHVARTGETRSGAVGLLRDLQDLYVWRGCVRARSKPHRRP